MKIGIHKNDSAYSKRWIEYCCLNKIDYKVVNAYDNNIVEQLEDCDIFMWHHHHALAKDVNFAKQLLYSLEQSGKKVFPNFKTGWHFDDKLGQKYLFESHGIPSAKSYAFYDKRKALEWINNTSFPKVFKLRGGAGSSNVKLVKSKSEGKRLINKAFGKGFRSIDNFGLAKDKFKLAIRGKAKMSESIRWFMLALFPFLSQSNLLPIHKGYIYFQEFIPNDGYDIRIEITGDKAIAMIRYARKGDFRASGSNNLVHDTPLIDKDVIDLAFFVADKLQLQSCALDLVREKGTGNLFVVENSYCYGVDNDEFDYGYWTKEGEYLKDEKFNGLDWIIESLIFS